MKLLSYNANKMLLLKWGISIKMRLFHDQLKVTCSMLWWWYFTYCPENSPCCLTLPLCRWWPSVWSSASPSPWWSSTSSSCLALCTGRSPLSPLCLCRSPCPRRTAGGATEHIHCQASSAWLREILPSPPTYLAGDLLGMKKKQRS